MDQLNKVLERLMRLQAETQTQRYSAPSTFAILEELSAFMKELPELLLTLDQARIDIEDVLEDLKSTKESA